MPPLYYGTGRDQTWECSSSFKKKKKLKTIFPESEKIIITLQHMFIIHKKTHKTAYIHNTQKTTKLSLRKVFLLILMQFCLNALALLQLLCKNDYNVILL